MIVWGMVGNSHDASLAVFDDDVLLWASLAKDFSDVPNDPDFNWTMLEIARHKYGAPSKIVWYERPFLKTLRQYWAGQGWLRAENNIKEYLKRWNITCKIEYTQHHLSHAAYAYYTQPHDDCAVIVMDSIGEFETLTIWHGKNNKLKKIHSQGYPHSLGLFYSAMTQRMGLQAQRDEYLVADMAAQGDPDRYTNLLLTEIVDLNQGRPFIKMRENMHRGIDWWRQGEINPEDYNDLAAAVQSVFETCLLEIHEWTLLKTKSKYLALAGGSALNRKAVNLIRQDRYPAHVPQNPGDPGSCVGAVLAQTKTKVTLDKQWYKAV